MDEITRLRVTALDLAIKNRTGATAALLVQDAIEFEVYLESCDCDFDDDDGDDADEKPAPRKPWLPVAGNR